MSKFSQIIEKMLTRFQLYRHPLLQCNVFYSLFCSILRSTNILLLFPFWDLQYSGFHNSLRFQNTYYKVLAHSSGRCYRDREDGSWMDRSESLRTCDKVRNCLLRLLLTVEFSNKRSGAKVRTLRTAWKLLQKDVVQAKIGFDTTENEPTKIWQIRQEL